MGKVLSLLIVVFFSASAGAAPFYRCEVLSLRAGTSEVLQTSNVAIDYADFLESCFYDRCIRQGNFVSGKPGDPLVIALISESPRAPGPETTLVEIRRGADGRYGQKTLVAADFGEHLFARTESSEPGIELEIDCILGP